ncbi:MAG: hypothetical protein SFV24_16970 [Gemmatimonadales bacterium]|nr:hypothetical protein [Gemmatimonadales bacterium]
MLTQRSRLFVSLILLSSITDRVAGQDRPVVFLHGLTRDQNQWITGANSLANSNYASPVRPNTVWRESFLTQAQTLSGALSGLTGIPAIAHSNGGLVGRRYVQQFGATSKVNAIATVGTPHRGAPAIASALSGQAVSLILEPAVALSNALNFYLSNDPALSDNTVSITLALIMRSINFFLGLTAQASALVGAAGIPVGDLVGPVISDMVPTSSTIASLNGTSNLSSEASRLLRRTGISTGISPYEVLLRGVLQAGNEWIAIRYVAQYGAGLLCEYYSAHADPWLASNAWRWCWAHQAIATFDVRWHIIIGSYISSTYVGGRWAVNVESQDGLVPLSTSTYPGATSNLVFPDPIYSIRHGSQPFSATVLNALSFELKEMGVGLRSGPNGALSGPGSVRSGATCLWTATGSGGTPPYSFQWLVNGLLQGSTTNELIYQNGGSAFRVDARITDSHAQSVLVSKNVAISGTAPQCLF